MRYLWIILLPLLLTSLNAQPQFHLSVETGAQFEVTGSSFEDLLHQKSRVRNAQKQANNLAASWQTLSQGSLGGIINTIDGLGRLAGKHQDGVQLDTHALVTARFEDLFLRGDRLQFTAGSYSQAGLHSYVNLDSLFGFRLIEMDGSTWMSNLDNWVLQLGPMSPATHAGKEWAHRLALDGIYMRHQADTIAALAEIEGIDFSGLSGELLADLLNNQATNIGDSLEGGGNPLASNKSLILARRAAWQEFGAGYSIPVTSWFSFYTGARYIRGVKSNRNSRLVTYQMSQAIDDMTDMIGMSFLPQGDLRHTFGIDAALQFQPYDSLSITLRGRNLNAPVLQWSDTKLRFDPQVSMDIDWQIFSKQVPLSLQMSWDFNRVESLVLENFYRQNLQLGLLINPSWKHFGFSIATSALKNVAESYSPWRTAAAVGVRVYNIELEIGGNTSFESNVITRSIPRSFGFYGKLTLNLEW